MWCVEADAIKTVGASSDGAAPSPPTGLCSGGQTLTLTNGGAVIVPLVTADSGTGSIFKAGPLENSFGGIGYGVAVGGATPTQTLITFNLDNVPATVISSVAISVANNPDLANAFRANIYDTTRVGNGGFLLAGTQTTAPCTGGLANCLHWRGYTNTTASLDTQDLGVITASGYFILYRDEVSSTYWVAYTISGGSTIRKFDNGLTSIGAIAVTPNLYGDITGDGTYIYTTINLVGVHNIRRIKISDLTITDFPIVGAASVTAIYAYGGSLYVGIVQGGTGNIKQVNPATGAVTGTIVLGMTEDILRGGQLFDAVNNRLYVVTNDTGVATNYRRVNLSTFTNEQTLNTGIIPQTFGTGFDLPHQHIWQASITGVGVGNQFILQKVNLCS
jgi:hypothetical protein